MSLTVRTSHSAHRDRAEQAQHRELVGPDAERVKEEQDREAVEQLADDLRALADESVQAEELAQPLARREPHQEDAVGDLDAAQAAAQDRAGGEEERQADARAVEPERDGAGDEPDDPGPQHDEEGPLRPEPVDQQTPAERGDDGDDGQRQEHEDGLRVRQAHRPDGHHAHHHDDRVDRVGVEEPGKEEAQQSGDLASPPHRLDDPCEGLADVVEAHPFSSAALADHEEDRDREDAIERRGEEESSGDRHVEHGDHQPDRDRPEVADGHADPREPAPGRGVAHDRQGRVVVHERRLVGEVRDHEQEQAGDAAGARDERGRDDAQRGEEEQERESAAGAIRQSAERG